jgi:mRNA interferase HigB
MRSVFRPIGSPRSSTIGVARAVRARWLRPSDLRAQFGATVYFVAGNRAIFDIGGNKYRLVVKIGYAVGLVLVSFVGVHAAYDRIDARTI